jgi:hypothetical protein
VAAAVAGVSDAFDDAGGFEFVEQPDWHARIDGHGLDQLLLGCRLGPREHVQQLHVPRFEVPARRRPAGTATRPR